MSVTNVTYRNRNANLLLFETKRDCIDTKDGRLEVERAKILAGSRRDEPNLRMKLARRDETSFGTISNWRDEMRRALAQFQIGETSRDELWLEPTSQKRARFRL